MRVWLGVYAVASGAVFLLSLAAAWRAAEAVYAAALTACAVGVVHAYWALASAVANEAERRSLRRGDFLVLSLVLSPLVGFLVMFALTARRPRDPR